MLVEFQIFPAFQNFRIFITTVSFNYDNGLSTEVPLMVYLGAVTQNSQQRKFQLIHVLRKTASRTMFIITVTYINNITPHFLRRGFHTFIQD